jgi:hypothetical protein
MMISIFNRCSFCFDPEKKALPGSLYCSKACEEEAAFYREQMNKENKPNAQHKVA